MIHEKPPVSLKSEALTLQSKYLSKYTFPQPEVVLSSRLIIGVPLSISLLLQAGEQVQALAADTHTSSLPLPLLSNGAHSCKESAHKALLPRSHLGHQTRFLKVPSVILFDCILCALLNCSSWLCTLKCLRILKRNTCPHFHASKEQGAVEFHVISDTSNWKIHKTSKLHVGSMGPP